MNKNKNWFSGHLAIAYGLSILVFLGLVFIAYFLGGPSTCAMVSFGLPGVVFAYFFGWENGRTDVLRKQEEQTQGQEALKS